MAVDRAIMRYPITARTSSHRQSQDCGGTDQTLPADRRRSEKVGAAAIAPVPDDVMVMPAHATWL